MPPVLTELKVLLDLKVYLVFKEPKVQLAHKAQQVLKVQLVLKVRQEHKEQLDLKELQEHKEQ